MVAQPMAGIRARAKLPAKAGADRKESDLAGGPVERAGPESECRAARPAVQQRVPERALERDPLAQRHYRKPAADAAAQIEEPEEEPEPLQESRGLVAKPPLPVRAWEPKAPAKVRRKPRLRVPARFPFQSKQSGAIHSIPPSAGA